MPANKKYLTTSPVQKIAKISAAILGGYIVTEAIFMALIALTSPGDMIFTLRYAGFILWAVLMILAFIAKNGLIVWGVYLSAAALFYLLAYSSNSVFL